MMAAALRKAGMVVLVAAFAIVLSCTAATPPTVEAKDAPRFHAVIIRGAGYLPGTKKPKGVDVITHATSKGGNTYVFSDKLVEKLAKLGTATKVVDFSKCRDLKCVYRVDKTGGRCAVDLVVFAGPSHYSKLPVQLYNLIPKLKAIAKAEPNVVCSSLVSAKYPAKGQTTIKDADARLKKAGAKTVMGLTLDPNVKDKELEKKLGTFAASLVAEMKKAK